MSGFSSEETIYTPIEKQFPGKRKVVSSESEILPSKALKVEDSQEASGSQLSVYEYYKIVMVGDSQCGKSWFCCCVTDHILPMKNDYFIAKDYLLSIKFEEEFVPYLLCDTDDKVNYTQIWRETNAVLLCFAIDDTESLNKAKGKWYGRIRAALPEVPIVLVGMKCDLRPTEDSPSTDQKQQLDLIKIYAKMVKEALKLYKYVECSGYTNENIHGVIKEAISAIKACAAAE